ncbi:MAG: hypothetical protein AB8H80_23035, partial [Planctomycetota bacterium]
AAIYYGVNGFAAAACVAIALGLLLALHYALRHLQLPLSKFLRSARDGFLLAVGIWLVLLALDFAFAPEGWWRILVAGFVGGPIVGLHGLRVLKSRGQAAAAPSPLADSASS